MSKQIWFISDTHFGHANILNFKDADGEPVRIFQDSDHMDEHMIRMWNSVVGVHDRVYHLGDVAINKKYIEKISRCNGKKVLIMGNHDIFGHEEYLKHFEDIRAYKIFPKEGIVCSHIPVFSATFERWKLNVHGHLHSNLVLKENKHPDDRYLNVSVEKINYTPISFDDIIKKIDIW